MSTATSHTLIPTATWIVDPASSRVEFQAKHLRIAPVRGMFGEFEGTLEVATSADGTKASGFVSAASVETGNQRRDAHLRSASFLDSERFPRLAFQSSEIRPADAGSFEIDGRLSMHGVTRPITLTAAVHGAEEGADGTERIRLEVAGQLSRRDFGITFMPVLVSDRVDIRLDLSAVRAERE